MRVISLGRQWRGLFAVWLGLLAATAGAATPVRVWTTTLDLRQRLAEGPGLEFETAAANDKPSIVIDPQKTFQTILGMGASLEHSTCSNLSRLPATEQARVIRRLVSPTAGIGMNLMRICLGTSDFAGEPWYSYDDVPAGETDPELRKFSIQKDRAYVLPAIQRAHRSNPDLLFFASPWSPPGWMKTTGSMIGGELLPRWYSAYAQYFVRFLQAYEAEGIPVYALTVQNEPGVDRAKEGDPKGYYPSCHWTGEQERDFIRDHLGPALRRAGLKTRIWCYDHNYNLEPKGDSDGLGHPRTILQDAAAAAWVDGVAFHHYEGQPSGMTRWHEEFPDKPIYYSEGSVFEMAAPREIMDRLRNWPSSFNAWVIMLDEQGHPNNGPFPASHAILRLHSDTLRVEELFEFYAYGHFTKFIPRGSMRIASTLGDREVGNIAFRTPDGAFVLVVVNTTKQPTSLAVRCGSRSFTAPLGATSVATFVWKDEM